MDGPREPNPKMFDLKRLSVLASLVIACCAWLVGGCATSKPSAPTLRSLAERSPKVPVVLVPGITGSELRDRRTGELIWGLGKQIVTPHDGGYELVRPLTDPIDGAAAHVEAGEVLSTMHLGPLKKTIYGPIPEMLENHGYVPGDFRAPAPEADLFTFAYDWRGDNIFAARTLRERLEALADHRGDGYAVDLICQSNGAHICRYLLKYGAESLEQAESGNARPSERFRIRKIILVGTSNGGSMRILREVHRGRKYLPLVGRVMQPEVLFSFPAVFQDLPAHIDEPFVDAEGRPVDLPLFEADTWVQKVWSVFQPEAQARMAEQPDLFGDREQQIDYLRRALDRAQRLHRLLATDVPHFGDTRYYSLQNGYTPTPHLAIVGARPGELWFTDDKHLKDRPYLTSLISRPGDGHATVDSQGALSPQELAAFTLPPYLVHGGHFELILEPNSLRRLLDFLDQP